ncbi:carboxypeptidase-like regulatory domain-containing protein [Parabacteroides goldsteinii]|uniref:carboxypeptidase-like regulatory domain-containing protein n=1 Tax=Parabacteroides goldsteinii TaxID=328812 RepID=UPI002AB88F76|nr:carboxypeptidase-like regulatory domain-containing protein [Parabacteroides goldsteinii]MDZ3925288.1 carboxypeptidase-like regulatory domain-containing protein [Parabacteroides goldsteinii]
MCTVVAQNVKVTGTVTAADDGLPIIGASVLVKGTTIGTVTDIEGRFSLDVPPEGKILQISYVGMNMQEVAVKPVIKVLLQSDTQNLDEVVVTAMGITRSEKTLGYSATTVKADEIISHVRPMLPMPSPVRLPDYRLVPPLLTRVRLVTL